MSGSRVVNETVAEAMEALQMGATALAAGRLCALARHLDEVHDTIHQLERRAGRSLVLAAFLDSHKLLIEDYDV
jgi:hypothetical protein